MTNLLYKLATLFVITVTAFTLSSCASKPGVKTEEEVKNSDWHYKMGVGYFESHQIPLAIRELSTALEKDPKNADAHYLLGFIYFGRNQFEKAYVYFDSAVKSRDNFFTAINNRGTTLFALERWKDAINDFQQLIEQPLYSTPELAYNNLGWAYYQLEDYETALHHFKMAIFLKPGFCLGYNNQGLAQEALELIDAATLSFQTAIEKCGDSYAEPHYHLGKIYAAEGNPQALLEFKKCIDINPEANIAQRCREFGNILQAPPQR